MFDSELVCMTNEPALDPGTRFFGYLSNELVNGFDVAPTNLFSLPFDCGIGHGFSIAPGNRMYAALSEARSRPNTDNSFEELWVIPPDIALSSPRISSKRTGIQRRPPLIRWYVGDWGWVHPHGARSVTTFSDGRVLISSGGGVNAIATPSQLAGVRDIRSIDSWRVTGANGEINGWDCEVTPTGTKAWFAGADSLYRISFEGPPGVTQPDKVAKGNNIGAGGWGGKFAFTAANDCLLVQSDRSAIARFSEEQLDELGPVPTNPMPASSLTCPLWDTMNLNNDSLWTIALDITGGGFVGTYGYASPFPLSRLYYFEREQFEIGGPQMPIKVITAVTHGINDLRFMEGYGLYLR